MKTCFFTIIEDRYKPLIELDLFVKSFKHFHPDIPLFILGEQAIAKLKVEHPGIDMFKIKASAAKWFYEDYDLVVNIDADHFIFSRLDEVLANDYDVACPSNYNCYENVGISIESYRGNRYNIVPELRYRQAGLIASGSKLFWDTYETASLKHADNMTCRDNDVLNLVIEFGNFKYKVLDGDYHYSSPNRKAFYGCSSLNLERQATIVNDVPCINGIPLKAYHVARGGGKPKFVDIFNKDVVDWFFSTVK